MHALRDIHGSAELDDLFDEAIARRLPNVPQASVGAVVSR